MSSISITVTTEEKQDAGLISNVINNALEEFGFTDVTNNCKHSPNYNDEELVKAVNTINPGLLELPVDIYSEVAPAPGGVDDAPEEELEEESGEQEPMDEE